MTPSATNQEVRPDKLEDKFWQGLYPMYRKKKKLEKDMKVMQKTKAREVYLEALDIGLTDNDAANVTAVYVSSLEFLLPHLQKIQRVLLAGDRSSVRLLKQVPYLYASTELRPFWDYALKNIKKKKSGYSDLHTSIRDKKYLNIVKKNVDAFLTQYNRIMDMHRSAIMQTEFKLQLVVGSDVAKYILSYV